MSVPRNSMDDSFTSLSSKISTSDKIMRFLLSPIGLILLVCLYLVLGTIVFYHLEGKYEDHQRSLLQQEKLQCLKELWKITEQLNVLYARNWTSLALVHISKYENHLTELITRDDQSRIILYQSAQWSLSSSFYYSLSIITTTGHGNLSPKTVFGKVVTITYAMLGIPLMFTVLFNCSNILKNILRIIYLKVTKSNEYVNEGNYGPAYSAAHVKKHLSVVIQKDGRGPAITNIVKAEHFSTASKSSIILMRSDNNQSELTDCDSKLTIAAPFFLLLVYLIVETSTISHWQNVSYLDACYICFLSLTTIGFNMDSEFHITSQLTANSVCFTFTYCLFTVIGLIIITCIFSTVTHTVTCNYTHLTEHTSSKRNDYL